MRARVVVGVAVLLAAAGCGSSDAPAAESSQPDRVTLTPAANGVQSVEVDADDTFRFHPSTIDASPGPIRVTLRHVGKGAPHDFSAAALPGAQIGLVTAGQSSSVTFTVSEPGTYQFVCTIHQAQGQVGQLVVAGR